MFCFVFQLTAAPVNTRALSFLSAVAGEALTKHLNKILPALISSLANKIGTPDEQQVGRTELYEIGVLFLNRFNWFS